MPSSLKIQLSVLPQGETQVRVVESPTGEPRHTLSLPFDEVTERALLQVLEKGSLDRCQLDNEELDALRSLGVIRGSSMLGVKARNQIIGRELFASLFPTHEDPDRDVRRALDATLTLAQQRGTAIPFQLRFDSDAVELAHLPWELICYPADQHPVAAGRLRFTRYITFGQAVAPFPVADRLEVLVVTARPVDLQPLDPQAERQAIEDAFSSLQRGHRVRIQHLHPPTMKALVAAVNARSYDVVHFDGHGAFARRCPFCEEFQAADLDRCINPDCSARGARLGSQELQGCLAFERSATDHSKHLVGAQGLAEALTDRHVRLFVASACQSGTIGGTSVFSGIGPRLIMAGVPAVVSMQFSVAANAAADFASEFYAGLSRGESIAAATAAGRRSLNERGLWYIPAVYLRSRDGEGYLFRHRAWHYLQPKGDPAIDWASLRSPDAAPYKFLSPYEITDHVVFHGRGADTQRVVEEVLHRRFAVLYGPQSVGKTSLVNAGLTPALIDRGYLIVTVREYGDPVDMLRQEIAASPALDVDPRQARTLTDAVRLLQEAVDRPLVLVFDEFEDFLSSSTADQRQAFVDQFADYAAADFPHRCCVLLVLRRDALGGLQAFQADMPEIFHALIPLDPLTREQARQAIEEPLKTHDPPMSYDQEYLRDTLIPDLCTAVDEDAINPAHLQIVCQELYQAARRKDTSTINADLYPAEGAKEILAEYLRTSLGRLGPEKQDLARSLLKQMVSGTGERVFVALDTAVAAVGTERAAVQAVLDILLSDGLLETGVTEAEEIAYSLSHHLLAVEVHDWFDREEALNRCAQQALDGAWDDWYGQFRAPASADGEPASDSELLLVAPDRLREIRQRLPHVVIGAPQICLLLRSAVYHRCDMAFWASYLEGHGQARRLLKPVHSGWADEAREAADQRQAILCAEALGLKPDGLGKSALARAAVAHPDGNVRHSAALALGALLGALELERVREAQQSLVDAAPPGRRWRWIQALAQIKAAGLALPPLSPSLLARVNAWWTGIRLYEARWPLTAQTLGASIGGGVPLTLVMLAVVGVRLIAEWIQGEPAQYLQLWVGDAALRLLIVGLVGAVFAATRWLLGRTRLGGVGRVLGGGLGFCLGMLTWILYMPDVGLWQIGAWILVGAAVALGWELNTTRSRPSTPWRAGFGGCVGGAIAFGAFSAITTFALVKAEYRLAPLLHYKDQIFSGLTDAPWLPWVVVAVAVLSGAAIGGGMAAGAVVGELLWSRLSPEPGGS